MFAVDVGRLKKGLDRFVERGAGVLLVIAGRDPPCEGVVIGMFERHRGGDLRGELIQFTRRYTVVQALDNLLAHPDGIDTQPVSQGSQSLCDLVETDSLTGAVPLEDLHLVGRHIATVHRAGTCKMLLYRIPGFGRGTITGSDRRVGDRPSR